MKVVINVGWVVIVGAREGIALVGLYVGVGVGLFVCCIYEGPLVGFRVPMVGAGELISMFNPRSSEN